MQQQEMINKFYQKDTAFKQGEVASVVITARIIL